MNRVSLICLLDINVGCKFEKREKKKNCTKYYYIHYTLQFRLTYEHCLVINKDVIIERH